MKETLGVSPIIIVAIVIGLVALGVAGVAVTRPVGLAPMTRTFDVFIDHQDMYARPAAVAAGLPKDTKIATFYRWWPDVIVVYKGDTVVLNVTNDSGSRVHSLVLAEFGVNTKELGPAAVPSPWPKTKTVKFVADKAGVFTFMCGIPFDPTATPVRCSPEHEFQMGQLIVLER